MTSASVPASATSGVNSGVNSGANSGTTSSTASHNISGNTSGITSVSSSTATLHFLCGKAGAGKSTIAQTLCAQHHAILLCEDVWLARLYGAEMQTFENYLDYAGRLKSVLAPLVTQLLHAGQSVVLDFPANTIAARRWYLALAGDAPHCLHFVDTPDALCLERITRRNLERPEGSHHLTEEQFHYLSGFFQAPTAAEQYQIKTWLPSALRPRL